MADALPETLKAWQDAVDNTPLRLHSLNGLSAIALRAQASGRTISASKMKFEDFLALRVLWSERDGPALAKSGLFDDRLLKRADKVLNEHPTWQRYKDHLNSREGFDKPYLPRGDTFSLVNHYFRSIRGLAKRDTATQESGQISYNDGTQQRAQAAATLSAFAAWLFPDTSDSSSSRGHTRNSSDVSMRDVGLSPSASPAARGKQRQREPFSSPMSVKSFGHSRNPSLPVVDEMMDDVFADSRVDVAGRVFQRESSIISDGQHTMSSLASNEPLSTDECSLTPDEQVVNLALVSFLTTITLGAKEVKSTWCIDRFRFKLKGILEARTDGYLRYRKQKDIAAALIECKSIVREACKPKVQYQESGQFSAWVFEDDMGDFNNPLSKEDGLFRRISISMNHSEIYILVATFGQGYKEFLEQTAKLPEPSDKPYPVTEESFMHVRSYGPFDVLDGKKLSAVARYVAAISIAQDSDAITTEADNDEAAAIEDYNLRSASTKSKTGSSTARQPPSAQPAQSGKSFSASQTSGSQQPSSQTRAHLGPSQQTGPRTSQLPVRPLQTNSSRPQATRVQRPSPQQSRPKETSEEDSTEEESSSEDDSSDNTSGDGSDEDSDDD